MFILLLAKFLDDGLLGRPIGFLQAVDRRLLVPLHVAVVGRSAVALLSTAQQKGKGIISEPLSGNNYCRIGNDSEHVINLNLLN